ncbi:30S ribosomal protein S1 [Proteiniclasticum sp. QWL-01]|nr:30S ribosomal protein S1 [Proteiniclasticum sp. QWL-01]WFF71613.1 30S ribosomal protein S1 [Proteiniclasticum sp. QWL-01]
MENENKNTQEEILTSQSPVEETVAAETAVEETTNEVQEEVAAEVAAEPVEEAEEAEMSMEQGMAEMSTMSIKPGQVLNGKVIKVTPDNVFVNINYMSDGIVPKNEFINNPDADLTELIKEGDEIKVSVMKVNDGEGNVLLSKRRAEADASVQNIERAMAEGTSVMAKVKEAVKGGLRVEVMGLQGFMPASLASDSYIPDLSVLAGKEMEVKVIEFDRAKKRAVVSRKELDRAEKAVKREETLKTLEKGAMVDGTVTKLMNYGAFIDIGGIEGLAHISDLSWGRIKHPSDIVNEGDQVKVIVREINPTTGKISLSMKTSESDPWNNIEKYQVGESYPGKVMNIIKSGAFVELEPGLEGYLHISELAEGQVEKVEDVVQKGQEISVRVKDFNTSTKKMSLTMREGSLEREFSRGERPARRERFENMGERKEREPRQRRERPQRSSSNRGSFAEKRQVDRGYHDSADNLTLGDLFGDLKEKMNFGDDEN